MSGERADNLTIIFQKRGEVQSAEIKIKKEKMDRVLS